MANRRITETVGERIRTSSQVNQVTGCWEWLKGKQSNGYGMLWDPDARKQVLAHRASYEFFKGVIQSGMVADHLCRNHGCVNPEHLRVISQRENTLASGSQALAKKAVEATHCPRGHSYSGENLITYTGPNGRIYKRCRVCRQASGRKAMAKFLDKKRQAKTQEPIAQTAENAVTSTLDDPNVRAVR